MTNKSVEQSKILVDLASLDGFVSEFSTGNLQYSDGVRHYEAALQSGKQRQLFDFLCNVISFENIVFDNLAMHSYSWASELLRIVDKSGLSEISSLVYFPLTDYLTACKDFNALAKILLEKSSKRAKKTNARHLEHLLNYDKARWVDDATLKDVYDRRYFIGRPDFDFQ